MVTVEHVPLMRDIQAREFLLKCRHLLKLRIFSAGVHHHPRQQTLGDERQPAGQFFQVAVKNGRRVGSNYAKNLPPLKTQMYRPVAPARKPANGAAAAFSAGVIPFIDSRNQPIRQDDAKS